MEPIKFTIYGNQENPEGNPIPYLRLTQNQLWMPSVRRYMNWQDHVRKAHRLYCGSLLGFSKDTKARMNLKIYWANGAHGDPDNIFKGIADALFKNDKNLDGSFVSEMASDKKGRVEVEIIINNQ